VAVRIVKKNGLRAGAVVVLHGFVLETAAPQRATGALILRPLLKGAATVD
jgi:hypothetical protein